ncbi:hypothetical protein [Paramagnetospirillum kuznetsovii]|nr:hypothetical protein [Paramagnetospirillum kuznetsovii]
MAHARRMNVRADGKAKATPHPEGIRDAVRPSGLAALIWAPIIVIVVPVAAVASGVLTLFVRAFVVVADGLALGVAHGRRAWLGLKGRVAHLVKPIFTFEPASTVRDRPSDARFLAEQAKPAIHPGPTPATPEAVALVRRAIAETEEKGDNTLPEDINLLAELLSDPLPRSDFQVSDMVRDCFAAFGNSGIRSRALLAVALHLSRHFARPSRLPLATTRAWRMLDSATFEEEIAAQLSTIGRFILDWQKSQQTFLVLEHAEIEMIEIMFESLHPGRHPKEMAEVLNFKVLSNRRQGLLRRMPHRLRKAVLDAGGRGPEAVAYVTAAQAFLNEVASGRQYQPIIDAATAALEEIGKTAEKVLPPAQPALPAPPGAAAPADGQALARITPVKMPASELAERAIKEATAQQSPARMPTPATAPAPAPAPALAPALAPAAAAAPQAPAARIVPTTALPPQLPQRPQAPQSSEHVAPASLPRVGGRLAAAGGPQFSAQPKPHRESERFGVASSRITLPSVATTAKPLPPGERPALPTVAMGPMPILAGMGMLAQQISASPSAPKAPAPVSGRITIPAPGAAPVAAAIAPAAAPQASVGGTIGAATGRIEPPSRPASVTDLTVVPQKKRPPITQAVKRQSVMKVLRGESASAVAAGLGIRVSKLDEWVDAFILAGAGALSSAKPKRIRKIEALAEPLSAEVLRAKLAEVLATAQMIERAMEAQLPPRRPILLPPPDHGDGRPVRKGPRNKG